MSVLEEYTKKIQEETTIDRINIEDISMKLPARKHYWLSRYISHKKALNEYEKVYDETLVKLIDNTIKTANIKLSYNDALKIVKNNENLIKIEDNIKEIKLIIEYLEKVEKIYSSMSFDISNTIKLITAEMT